MKRSLISLSLAALVSANLAAAHPGSTQEGIQLDRSLPTYPELGFDRTVRVQIAAESYRFNAGESTHDLVVQDVGSG